MTISLILSPFSTVFAHTARILVIDSKQRVALRKLIMIDNVGSLEDLRVPPANHLEALRGDREGQYSIRINDQYRICFEVEGNNFYNVEIVDYH